MKPALPEGFRDFTPEQISKRNFIFNNIRQVFTKFGYQPIETPTMEKLSTLTGKYGEEGDRLLFKVLNNGDFLAKANKEALAAAHSNQLIASICDRGLRYDLTVPFARYVVMRQNEIAFPFKRYQIQPVWRADRPQKGRYREFYQCDVDVVGSDSLMYEAELIQIYDEVFCNLGVHVIIKMNNRKVLEGLAEAAGCLDKFVDMTVALDKIDKIGMDGVRKEMQERGITNIAIDNIEKILTIKDLATLKTYFINTEIGLKGIEELVQFHEYFDLAPASNKIEFDITLARGLSYYTGCIMEVVVDSVKHPTVKMGSIGGGGRYDNLTGIFGLPNMSGVGVSFGAERIYDVMEELGLFPIDNNDGLKVLLLSFDKKSHLYAFNCLNELRKAGINADLYPEPTKMQKQMKYANARKAPYVLIIGETEIESGNLMLKNMESGEQQQLKLSDIVSYLNNN